MTAERWEDQDVEQFLHRTGMTIRSDTSGTGPGYLKPSWTAMRPAHATEAAPDYTGPESWTEKIFQGQVMRLLRERGYWHYHAHDSRRSDKGFPDVLAGHDDQPERLIVMELKAEDGEPTIPQMQMLDRFAAMNFPEVYLFQPHHWDNIVEVLETKHRPPYLAGDDTGRWKVRKD